MPRLEIFEAPAAGALPEQTMRFSAVEKAEIDAEAYFAALRALAMGYRIRIVPLALSEAHQRGELTSDQIAYLHELADERRRAWLEAGQN